MIIVVIAGPIGSPERKRKMISKKKKWSPQYGQYTESDAIIDAEWLDPDEDQEKIEEEYYIEICQKGDLTYSPD